MKIKTRKGIDGQLDIAWSLLVKVRAGWKCEYCHTRTKQLQSHHIYSRSKKSTRWNIDNGVCLCAGHHVLSSTFSAHQTPVEFTEWLYKTKGDDFMTKLRWKAHEISKLHLFEKTIVLELMEAEIAVVQKKATPDQKKLIEYKFKTKAK